MFNADTRGQFIRYVIVGMASNSILYVCYLILTSQNIGHKTAMTILYVVGVAQTFVFNKTWSFKNNGSNGGAFFRYITSYIVGYILNLAVLWMAVDKMDLPHEVIQAMMVFFLAIMLFLLQKFWVFPDRYEHRSSIHF